MAKLFSKEYYRALELAKTHHASSKTYSGKFLRPHAPFIKELIVKHDCRTLLDYGCGKGRQYEWVSMGGEASIPEGMTLRQFFGVEISLYDPAYPPFSREPKGSYDIVVCTHTLGSIPISDLEAVVDRIYRLASKSVYIAEKIGTVKKNVFDSSGISMPRWSAAQWESFLSSRVRSNLEVVLSTREITDNGVITTRRHIP